MKRPPDFVIGPTEDPYLRRWWIIPRNRWFNIYLHQMLHDDEDRALHDHPWWNVSIILRGGYLEVTKGVGIGVYRLRSRTGGHVIVRSPRAAHRLMLAGALESWSLFITGPRVREWGFHCPKGWVHWEDFTDPKSKGEVGRGCE